MQKKPSTPDTSCDTTPQADVQHISPDSAAQRLLLSIPEVAKRLGVSEMTVRRRISDGSLPYHRIGRLLFCTPTDIETLLSASARIGKSGR